MKCFTNTHQRRAGSIYRVVACGKKVRLPIKNAYKLLCTRDSNSLNIHCHNEAVYSSAAGR